MGVFQNLIEACQQTDQLATEILLHPLQFERNEPFILGEKNPLAGQRSFPALLHFHSTIHASVPRQHSQTSLTIEAAAGKKVPETNACPTGPLPRDNMKHRSQRRCRSDMRLSSPILAASQRKQRRLAWLG